MFFNHLPSTIFEAYEHILKNSPMPDDTRRLLHIILAAVRPLTLREMNIALHMKDDDRSHEEIDLIPEERFPKYIKNICGLFVNIYDGKVYLLHQTAKEFLLSRDEESPTNGNTSVLRGDWQYSIKLQDSH